MRRTRRPSLFLAQLWKDAGLPDGVFTVLQGDKVAVDELLTNPDVKAISPSSARRRSRATSTRPAPRHGKRVQALGGAKNHVMVLPDADLDMAADAMPSPLRTARRVSGAWRSLRRGRGRTTSATELVDAIAERDCPSSPSAGRCGTDPTPTWAR